MNEETNNPFEVVGDHPLEARVVAWVLGEASAFEAEELGRLCKEMPELEVFRRRIEAVHGLAGEALKARTGDWKLPPEKRAKVFASIGAVQTEKRRESTSRWASRRAMWMLAACLVLTATVAALVFPLFFARAWKSGSPQAEARMMKLSTELPPELIEGTPRKMDLSDHVGKSTEAGAARFVVPAAPSEGAWARNGRVDQAGVPADAPVSNGTPLAQREMFRRQAGSAGGQPPAPATPPPAAEPTPATAPVPARPVAAAPEAPVGQTRRENEWFDRESKELKDSNGGVQEEARYKLDGSAPAAKPASGPVNRSEPAADPAQANEEDAMVHSMVAERKVNVPQKPSAPSSSTAKVIAATTSGATVVPVPEVNMSEHGRAARAPLGDGDDFGDGWGNSSGGAGGGGGVGGQAIGDRTVEGNKLAIRAGTERLAEEADGRDSRRQTDAGLDFFFSEFEPPAEKEVTTGLRSGDAAVTRDQIDAVLNGPAPAGGQPPVGRAAVIAGTLSRDDASAFTGTIQDGLENDLTKAKSGPEAPKPESAAPATATAFPVTPATPTVWSDMDSDGEQLEDLKAEIPALGRLFRGKAAETENRKREAVDGKEGAARIEVVREAADESTAFGLERSGAAKLELEKKAPSDSLRGTESETRTRMLRDVDQAWDLGEASARQGQAGAGEKKLESLRKGLAEGNERLKQTESLRDEAKEDMIRKNVDTHDYVEAVKDFEQSQTMLEQMRLKYQGERITLELPRNPVVLHEEPATAEKPGWFSLDRRYRASSVVQINPRAPEMRLSGSEPAAGQAMTQQFFATEMEVAKAQKTLERVVDKLDLTKKWGVDKDAAIKKLKEGVAIENIKGTDLIKIEAKSADADESKEIALEVAKAYRARRAELEDEHAQKALQGLNKALREQEDRVEEKRKVLNTIIKTKGIPYRGKETLLAGSEALRERKAELERRIAQEGEPSRGARQLSSALAMQQRTYQVPGNFVEQLANGRATQASVPQLLQDNGIVLPQDAKVVWSGRQLTVTAPSGELGQIEALVSRMKPGPQDVIDMMAEVSAAKEPWSTFSLHVSDASFRVAQAAMARGQRPDKESVRPEEFYNAFDYGDPAPSAGEPVACTVEQAAHPLLPGRNLVRIAVRAGSAGRGAGTPLRLTVLLDNSGSMEREDRRAATREAVAQLVSLLGPEDRVTVVGFSRQPRLLAEQWTGPQAKEKLVELVAKTPPEGGTNLEEALRIGEELAIRQQTQGAQNRIVLLTDGAANLGNANPKSLATRVEALRQRGIAFDAAGIGADGMNDTLLEELTRDGNGRYYVIDGPQDADAAFARKLAGAFRPAAENVKVQVHFNPARVAGYRLIGFEEHRLKKEDFRNDAVDAAELAAEEAGVAIYQVELLPQGEGEIGEVSVRFRDVAAGRMVERTWPVAYDAGTPAFDQAKPSVQLAALAALTADILREGPLAPLVDHGQLAPVVNKVRSAYGSNQRVQELLGMWEGLRK